MNFQEALTNLRSATSNRAFVDACNDIVRHGRHCTLAEMSEIEAKMSNLRDVAPSDYSNWIDMGAGNKFSIPSEWLRQSFIPICFNSALNGGYFEADGNGNIRKWSLHGSGSRALEAWIAWLTEHEILPYRNFPATEDVKSILHSSMEGQTQAAWRLGVATSFAEPAILDGLNNVYRDIIKAGRVEFRHADMLGAVLPAGFGSDPFRKKALLALKAVASLGQEYFDIASDLPIPSDYQIPRILEWLGVIRLSYQFREKLLSDKMLDVMSEEITEFRAAAVVACERIAEILGIPAWDVDGRLFTTYRRNSDFIFNALPPMRCNSPWF